MTADGMVVMGYLPSRWDSGDEATGPQMDEITTVVLARRSVAERVRSAAPTTPAAGRGPQSFAACVDGRRGRVVPGHCCPGTLRTRRAAFTAPGSSRPVKMRCRRRRASASVRRQSIDSQSRSSSSGPFTTAVPWCPTYPLVLASSVIVYLTGPPDPRQHPFESDMRPYPASYTGRPTEGLVMCPGFLLPFGCRYSLLGSSFPR